MEARSQSSELVAYSLAVRESSLKRFRTVSAAFVNWRPTPTALSVADLARHILDADLWLHEKLRNPSLHPMVGHVGCAGTLSVPQFNGLLAQLHASGHDRAALIQSLSSEALMAPVADSRFGGVVTTWWLIVRGNLDHEAHHRGQLSVYLRLMETERTGSSA